MFGRRRVCDECLLIGGDCGGPGSGVVLGLYALLVFEPVIDRIEAEIARPRCTGKNLADVLNRRKHLYSRV